MKLPARADWLALDPSDQARFAAALAGELGSAWTYLGCEQPSSHPVAMFNHEGAKFALVPAASAQIGFDVRNWRPTEEERASWRRTVGGWEGRESSAVELSVEEHVARVTTRPRPVDCPAMLVEVAPRELGWRPADRSDPAVSQALREAKRYEGTSEIFQGQRHLRISRGSHGQPMVEEAFPIGHASVCEDLASSGFRLPTFDEWEYLCSGGAATLFRWGEHAPLDRYPTDLSPAEAQWRREWALSGGRLAPPKAPFQREYANHVLPNTHGLLIAYDPYKYEMLNEPGRLRGGDGGVMICGGEGYFVGWLSLASSYFDEAFCTYASDDQLHAGFVMSRRVLPLNS